MGTEPGPVEQPNPRNIWRDGLWIGALALLIVTIGAFYQVWLHLGPEGKEQRAELKGNGVDVPSYGFDLSKLAKGINPNEINASHWRRNEVAVLSNPGHISVTQNAVLTGREKYVLPTDRVIGVINQGQARAYPIQVMQVHQLANDALGNQLILVCYDPVADTANAWVALKQGDSQNTTASESPFLRFGVSGLEYKGLSLAYDYDGESKRGPSLWNLTSGQALAGPEVGHSLQADGVQCVVMQWRDWLKRHPATTILKRDPALTEEYKRDIYGPYYQEEKLMYPVVPQLSATALSERNLRQKSRGLAFVMRGTTPQGQREDLPVFIPYESVLGLVTPDSQGMFSKEIEFEDIALTLQGRDADVGFTPSTAWVIGMKSFSEDNAGTRIIPMTMLFAWYATYPNTVVLAESGGVIPELLDRSFYPEP